MSDLARKLKTLVAAHEKWSAYSAARQELIEKHEQLDHAWLEFDQAREKHEMLTKNAAHTFSDLAQARQQLADHQSSRSQRYWWFAGRTANQKMEEELQQVVEQRVIAAGIAAQRAESAKSSTDKAYRDFLSTEEQLLAVHRAFNKRYPDKSPITSMQKAVENLSEVEIDEAVMKNLISAHLATVARRTKREEELARFSSVEHDEASHVDHTR